MLSTFLLLAKIKGLRHCRPYTEWRFCVRPGCTSEWWDILKCALPLQLVLSAGSSNWSSAQAHDLPVGVAKHRLLQPPLLALHALLPVMNTCRDNIWLTFNSQTAWIPTLSCIGSLQKTGQKNIIKLPSCCWASYMRISKMGGRSLRSKVTVLVFWSSL